MKENDKLRKSFNKLEMQTEGFIEEFLKQKIQYYQIEVARQKL